MSISTAPLPPPPKKKSGWGCLGCGCAVLAVLALLFLALVGGALYVCYETLLGLTTVTAPAIPSFTGTDDQNQILRQKLADFDHDVMNHQAATIRLSADELNMLISRNPDVIKNKVQAFVTLTDTEGRVRASLPTDEVSHGWIKGRYCDFDISFEVHFDRALRGIDLTPHSLQIGDKPPVNLNSTSEQSTQTLRSLLPGFNQSLNDAIRKSPDGEALLRQAKSIEIQGGQLVIETQ